MLPSVRCLSQPANPARLWQWVRWKYQGETQQQQEEEVAVTLRSTQDPKKPHSHTCRAQHSHTCRAQHNYLQLSADYILFWPDAAVCEVCPQQRGTHIGEGRSTPENGKYL